ncbi:MAG TPA: TetR-like C-terminal domain-containing protein [Longimicrobiaceae bacterium]|nr:TetR-like C-terminal domain-containing protein [Longimicrobiaceae bacterium]
MMARKAGLSAGDVVAAAAEIADAEGADAVTLASVASRLGVRPPSLYAHVDGLQGVRRLLALQAARELGVALRAAVQGRTGTEALREVAHAYRRFAREHPGLYGAAQRAVRPGEDDELYRALAEPVLPVLRALGDAGVTEADRVHLARAFRSALHGFVVLERGGGFGMPESVDESFGRMVELLLAGVAASAGGR